MPVGLPEPVSILVSELLSCLGNKQSHWDDSSNQSGLLALGKPTQTYLYCFQSHIRQELGRLCPRGANLKPISSRQSWMGCQCTTSRHGKVARAWGRETQAVSGVALLEHEPDSRASSSSSHLSASALHCTALPAQLPEDLLAGAGNLPGEHCLTATAANMSLQKPEC